MASASPPHEVAGGVVEQLLNKMMRHVVDGLPTLWVLDHGQGPITEKAETLLRQCDGDVDAAVEVAAAQGTKREASARIIEFLVSMLPYLGGASVQAEQLWFRLRTVALIAALYGHDVRNRDVQYQIVICLVDTEVRNIREGKSLSSHAGRAAVRMGVSRVARTMVSSTVGRAVVGSAPLGVLWNAMSGDDGSAVAERARLHFRPATSRKTFQLHVAMLVLLLCKVVTPCRHVWWIPFALVCPS